MQSFPLTSKNLSIAFPGPDARPSPLQALIIQGRDTPWPYDPGVSSPSKNSAMPLAIGSECQYCKEIFIGDCHVRDTRQAEKYQHGISNESTLGITDVYRQTGCFGQPTIKEKAACPTLHSPLRLQYNIDFLMQCLDPHVHPARVNDFFNGLDIVLSDLGCRQYAYIWYLFLCVTTKIIDSPT